VERQNWQSHTIDFTQDKEDWAALDEELRQSISWNLSSFLRRRGRVPRSSPPS